MFLSRTLARCRMSQGDVAESTGKLIESLKHKLDGLRQQAVNRACALLENDLVKENEQLRGDIQRVKWMLIQREVENGRRQYFIPMDLRAAQSTAAAANNQAPAQPAPKTQAAPAKSAEASKAGKQAESAKQPAAEKTKADAGNQPAEGNNKQQAAKGDGKQQAAKGDGKQQQPAKGDKGEKGNKQPAGEKSGKPAGGAEKGKPAAAAVELPADIRRINFRIGRVVEVSKHPEADSLYVEKVDVGENGRLRTVVSGLVKHVPEEQLRNRLAIFMTNLKPAKLRGILSEGMIMCAANEDKSHLEILSVPPGCQPGDRVYAVGFEDGEPDEELNPKRKVWEDFVKPVLRTNADGVACFKDAPLRVKDREGPVHSNVKNAQIS